MKNLRKNILINAASSSVFILMFFLASSLKGQHLKEGFNMLETGQFIKAREFFARTLEKDSLNPTALICYGRAAGLSGDIEEAQKVFNKLLVMTPESEEVLLNLAESYLWDNDGKSAINLYDGILEKSPQNFAALLGYANSQSMLAEYATANEFIKKALAVQPDNQQAKISRKFIRLGYANKLASQDSEYEQALALVNANLQDDQDDQHSLMLKATIYLLKEEYGQAENIYTMKILDILDRYIGRSVTAHLLKKNKEALRIVREGLEQIASTGDSVMIFKIRQQYVSALLWNDKLRVADQYLDQLIEEYPRQSDLLSTKAMLLIYMSDYKNGADVYQKFLQNNPASFNGNLGLADANHALGMDHLAYDGAFRTLSYFPGQKDVIGFLDRLNFSHAPEVKAEVVLSKTSDSSTRVKKIASSSTSLSPRLNVSAGYYSEAFADEAGESIDVNAGIISLEYQINRRIKANAQLESAKANGAVFKENFSNYLVQAHVKVNKNHQLVLGHQKELQNFNKSLLTQNVSMNHFIVKNISFWKLYNIGWYSEAYFTKLSDGNSRNLLFTSIYKNLTKNPIIKTGLNFSTMSFTQTKPLEYYSPKSFYNYEWFAGLNVDQSKSFPVSILADFAIGYQISDQQNITAWRTKVEVKKRINRLIIDAHLQHNSLSAVSNNGFSFTEMGFSITYKLTDKPLFYNKIKSKNN